MRLIVMDLAAWGEPMGRWRSAWVDWSYKQNLWMHQLVEGAAYLPR